MKARPILMSAPMIRALLDGRKTQTRRIVKGAALDWLDGASFDAAFVAHPDNGLCPYGQLGDLLWVRETWMPRALDNPISRIMKPRYRADAGEDRPEWRGLWKPSIHMPRWASRLTLELTEVRVERLQAISHADAREEGLWQCESGFWWFAPENQEGCYYDPRWAYEELWESINGPGSWEANPWVWVLGFRVHQKNVDAVLAAKGAA